jgi:hypothetical protein
VKDVDNPMKQSLTLRQAQRLCRAFGTAGVHITPARLVEISGGATPTDDEHTDIEFAAIANGQPLTEQPAAEARNPERTRRIRAAGIALALLATMGWAVWMLFTAPGGDLVTIIIPAR